MNILHGQTAVVTAGASGIGWAVAKALSQQGMRLAICDIDKRALREAEANLPGVFACEADVSDTDAMASFFAEVRERFGGLDCLVNNAGIAGPTGRVDEISPSEFARCVAIGLTGQFTCAHHASPLLRSNGGGSIICMSSVAGKHGYAFRTPYAATKFGVIGLAQSLAKELGPDNIRVNAILPGFVTGPRMDAVIEGRAKAESVPVQEMRDSYLGKVSLRRMVTAEDVAEIIVFLLSSAGANISGQSIAVDGNVETL